MYLAHRGPAKQNPRKLGGFIRKDNEIIPAGLLYLGAKLEAGRRAAANLLTKDEARRIAVNIANRPPELGETGRNTRAR